MTDLQEEREGLTAEIGEAFAGVTREGGVSWSEADAIDSYGSKREQREARERDAESGWSELVGDESWDPDAQGHCWCYLDAKGFRYYLPAGMARSVRDGFAERLAFQLKDTRSADPALILLDDRQRRCVARFLRYMMAFAEANDDPAQRDNWRDAFEGIWKRYA